MIFGTLLLNVIKSAQVLVVRINNEIVYMYFSKIGHMDPPIYVCNIVRYKGLNNCFSRLY
jgi:hypothetical protein